MSFRNDLLSRLNDDILIVEIPKQLSASGFFNLAQVSRRFRFLAIKQDQGADLLRQLLGHAALGEWEKAGKIWQEHADLLTCHSTIYHPNCFYVEGQAPKAIPFDYNPGRYRYVNHTAWQIALMNEEYEEAEAMGKCMADEEKREQFNAIFPEGEIKKYNFDLVKAEQLLENVWNEVAKDRCINEQDLTQMEESTKHALDALYHYAKPSPEHTEGLVFDIKFYLAARRLYNENRGFTSKDEVVVKNWGRFTFWQIRVEEWLASCLGTGYLRAHLAGHDCPLSRSGCVLADNSSYFAFRRFSDSLPGLHFFIEDGGQLRTQVRAYGGIELRQNSAAFSTFVAKKIEKRKSFTQSLFNNSIEKPKYNDFFKCSSLDASAPARGMTWDYQGAVEIEDQLHPYRYE